MPPLDYFVSYDKCKVHVHDHNKIEESMVILKHYEKHAKSLALRKIKMFRINDELFQTELTEKIGNLDLRIKIINDG